MDPKLRHPDSTPSLGFADATAVNSPESPAPRVARVAGVVVDQLKHRKGNANRDSQYTWVLEASYCQFVDDNVVAVVGLLAPDAVQPMDASRIPSVAVIGEGRPHTTNSELYGERLIVLPA